LGIVRQHLQKLLLLPLPAKYHRCLLHQIRQQFQWNLRSLEHRHSKPWYWQAPLHFRPKALLQRNLL
jgi:hypothetical protein